MTNRSSHDPEAYQQEALGNDPSVTREAFDQVSDRLDGSETAAEQSDQAAESLPAEVESEIAAVAQDLSDLTMGIEDEA